MVRKSRVTFAQSHLQTRSQSVFINEPFQRSIQLKVSLLVSRGQPISVQGQSICVPGQSGCVPGERSMSSHPPLSGVLNLGLLVGWGSMGCHCETPTGGGGPKPAIN